MQASKPKIFKSKPKRAQAVLNKISNKVKKTTLGQSCFKDSKNVLNEILATRAAVLASTANLEKLGRIGSATWHSPSTP